MESMKEFEARLMEISKAAENAETEADIKKLEDEAQEIKGKIELAGRKKALAEHAPHTTKATVESQDTGNGEKLKALNHVVKYNAKSFLSKMLTVTSGQVPLAETVKPTTIIFYKH